MSDNVFPHQRALEFHATARHVLALACEKAVLACALRPDDAHALQLAARTKMHTAQVRQAIELVFRLSHAAKLAREHSARLLPAAEPTA